MTQSFRIRILKEYLNYNFNHHIQSYEDFINYGFDEIISNEQEINIKYDKEFSYNLSFFNLNLSYPTIIDDNRKIDYLSPNECRKRDLTYDSPLTCSTRERTYKNNILIKEIIQHNIVLGRIPIMVGSSKCVLNQKKYKDLECSEDIGGYFIIRGKERILVTQVRGNYNVPIVTKVFDNNYMLEIRSISEINCHSILVKIYSKDNSLFLSMSHLSGDIPIGIILKAFGLMDIESLIKYINYDKENIYHRFILYDCDFIKTEEEALDYIGKYSKNVNCDNKRLFAKQLIYNELFPHIGISANKEIKIYFLGTLIKKLIDTIVGIRDEDDKDHLFNKRFESSGVLLHDLFRQLFKRYVSSIENPYSFITSVSQNTSITKKIHSCFLTGNWGAQNSSYIREGVSQIRSINNYHASISHLQRINTPGQKESKNMKMRQVHPSYLGFICAAESPEGISIGLVENLAVTTSITCKIPTVSIRNKIQLMDNFSDLGSHNTFILLNGIPIGSTMNPTEFLSEFKSKRKNENREIVSISLFENEINIFSDSGRLVCPMFNTKNFEKERNIEELTFKELLSKKIIEIVDINELSNAVVGYEYDTNKDFFLLDASMTLGIMAGLIPFSDHSPAPRNCYSSSMSKQAIGRYSMAFNERSDALSYTMRELQKPIISTLTGRLFSIDKMGTGINCMVAMLSHEGWNQEDSVVMNKGSIERGLFTSDVYRSYCEIESRSTNNSTIFGIPPLNIRKSINNYNFLDSKGIVKRGVKVVKGTVIMGRINTISEKGSDPVLNDVSIVIKKSEEGIIERVDWSFNSEGVNQVKILIRSPKEMTVGDKVSCLKFNTKVLTKDGWKNIGNINTNDIIATLDPETDNLIYEKPLELFKYNFDGNMYHLRDQNIELTTTMKHRMWTREENSDYNFKLAEDCYDKELYYKKTISGFIPDNWVGKIDRKILHYIGAFMSDGIVEGDFVVFRKKVPLTRKVFGKYVLKNKTYVKIIKNFNRNYFSEFIMRLDKSQSKIVLKAML